MARALDLHSRGQGFDSLILHEKSSKIKIQSCKTRTADRETLNKKLLQNEKKAIRKNVHRNTEQKIKQAGCRTRFDSLIIYV